METRPQRQSAPVGDQRPAGAPSAIPGVADLGEGVVVLPPTPVVRTARPINWGAPDPRSRVHLTGATPWPAQTWRATTWPTTTRTVPARPRRTPRQKLLAALSVLCFTAMGLILLGVAADWGARMYGMNALVTEIQVSEGVMVGFKGQVAQVIAGDPEIDGPEKAQTRAELQRIAGEADEALARSADRLAAVQLLPWHDGAEAARDAYLDHSVAWQEYLGAAAGDPAELFEQYPQIDVTWERLAPALRDAVPSPAIGDIGERVEAILGDTSSEREPTAQVAA